MPYKNKQQQREYQKLWLAKRRQLWFSENGPCVVCDSREELQLDHVDPATKIEHRVWSWSQKRREKELAKCRVLCKDCHQEKSKTEAEKGEDRYSAKLSEQDVIAIRLEYQKGVYGKGYRALGKKYKVDRKVIDRIINGTIWKHVVS